METPQPVPRPKFELSESDRKIARAAIDETRPLLGELVDKMLDFATEFSGDEERTFVAIVKYVEVAIEVGRFDRNTMIALLSFAVRRLHYHTPQLFHSTPN